MKKIKGRLLAFSDLHAGKARMPETAFSILDQIFKLAKRHKVSAVLVPGDLFDTRGRIPVLVFNRVLEAFWHSGVSVVMIPGNHDLATSSGGVKQSALLAFLEESGDEHMDIRVMDSGSTVIQLDNGTAVVHCYGYDPSAEDLNQLTISRASERVPSAVNIAMYHQVTCNSETSGGWVFTEGLNADLLADTYDFSMVGDVHNPQLVRDNVLVPGAPYAMDFGDEGDRGCWMLDINGGEVLAEFIKLDSPKFSTREVSTPAALRSFVLSARNNPNDRFRMRYPESLHPLVEQVSLPSNVTPAMTPSEQAEVRVELKGTDQDVVKQYVDFALKDGATKAHRKRLIAIGHELLEGQMGGATGGAGL